MSKATNFVGRCIAVDSWRERRAVARPNGAASVRDTERDNMVVAERHDHDDALVRQFASAQTLSLVQHRIALPSLHHVARHVTPTRASTEDCIMY